MKSAHFQMMPLDLLRVIDTFRAALRHLEEQSFAEDLDDMKEGLYLEEHTFPDDAARPFRIIETFRAFLSRGSW